MESDLRSTAGGILHTLWGLNRYLAAASRLKDLKTQGIRILGDQANAMRG